MTYDYFYGAQADQFAFFRIPKLLFTDEHFAELSTDAKLLYGILLDRMNLSAKNGWLDKEGRVYIIFTIEEIKDSIRCAEKKAVRLMSELDRCGLIERKRQGLGKPNLIYVKNFIAVSPKEQFLNCQNNNTGTVISTTLDLSEAQGSNINTNNIDLNHTDSLPFLPAKEGTPPEGKRTDVNLRNAYREIIQENISFDILLDDNIASHEILTEIVDLMVDVVCTNSPYIRVARDEKPTEVVKSQFLKLSKDHIQLVLDNLSKNTTQVRNMRQYLIASLYNAPLIIGNYYRSLVNHDLYGSQ